jgi:hypothetical protein
MWRGSPLLAGRDEKGGWRKRKRRERKKFSDGEV